MEVLVIMSGWWIEGMCRLVILQGLVVSWCHWCGVGQPSKGSGRMRQCQHLCDVGGIWGLTHMVSVMVRYFIATLVCVSQMSHRLPLVDQPWV